MPTPTSKSTGKRSDRKRAQGASGPRNVLDEIYRNGDASKEDSLQRIDRSSRRSSRTILIILGVLLLLVSASAAGFFTFNRNQKFNEKGVSVRIETPSSVTSAGEAQLTFTVVNDERVGIKNVELTVAAPDGWTFKESDPNPRDANNSLWQLGSISAHGKKSVVLTGMIVGEVGSVKTFNATATYRPSNFNYDFSAKASGLVTIGSSILQVNLTGPTQVSPGAKAKYTLTYTNTSKDALKDVRFEASYPEGFSVASTTPEPREGKNVWAVDELKSGGTANISVEGSFSGNVGESRQLTFAGELQRGSQFEKQVETSLVVLLVESRLQAGLSVNGKVTEPTAAPGGNLSYEFTYRNTSDLELTNVVASLSLSGGALDAASFSDDYGAKLVDGKVVWDVKLIPQFASLKPDASGTIRFTAKVLTAPAATSSANGPTVDAQITVSTGGQGTNASGEKSVAAKTDLLITKITSNATLNVDPRYYGDEGDIVGAGPLPPTAGKTTTYRVSWYLGNTTNELQDVTVVATVPADVYWTGKNVTTTAGDISFEPNSRVVTWRLNRLPAGVGKDTSTLAVSFELSVTPADTDVGSSVALLGQSTLTAHDGFADATIKAVRNPVTTDLQNDPLAAGKGSVIAGT